MYDDPTPLSEDSNQMNEWVNDETSWTDVYSKKPTEYLEAIARGETPVWSSDLGKYVYDDSDSQVEQTKSVFTETTTSKTEKVDEDLPF
jgi:hypothetical protein